MGRAILFFLGYCAVVFLASLILGGEITVKLFLLPMLFFLGFSFGMITLGLIFWRFEKPLTDRFIRIVFLIVLVAAVIAGFQPVKSWGGFLLWGVVLGSLDRIVLFVKNINKEER